MPNLKFIQSPRFKRCICKDTYVTEHIHSSYAKRQGQKYGLQIHRGRPCEGRAARNTLRGARVEYNVNSHTHS